MNTRSSQKTLFFVLMYLSLNFTSSILAQVKPVQFPNDQDKSLSKRTGIMSKLDFLSQRNQTVLNQKFYSPTFLDKKHGFNPLGLGKTNGEYEYLEHLGTGMNLPFGSVTDTSGNTYITGAGSNIDSAQGDFVTIKIDLNGNIIWESRQSGMLYAVEYGVKISLDDLGNPIATGVKWNGNDMDIFTIKYDQNTGNELWSTAFDGGHAAIDAPTTMIIAENGPILIGGISYTGTSVEYLLLKYDASGQLLWSATDSNPITESWNEILFS